MTLRCQLGNVKCPSYKHHGTFQPDNKTVKSLLPDLNHCAVCIAHAAPRRPDLHEDLFQVAALTLIEKGPQFNPSHKSGAGFGSFIRPRICGSLMDRKKKELTHNTRERLNFDSQWHLFKNTATEVNQNIGWVWEVQDPHAEFEDELVRDLSFASALPTLLKVLTPREREIFDCIREDQRNSEIAEVLNLSESRVSQLVSQVTLKLTEAARKLGLAD